jgi:hypothetical protein
MNIYSNFFQYGTNNPNAISDGDDKGRGENASGQIGTKTDILGNLIGDPGRLGLLGDDLGVSGEGYWRRSWFTKSTSFVTSVLCSTGPQTNEPANAPAVVDTAGTTVVKSTSEKLTPGEI